MFKDDEIIWRTIGGRRIPIKTGQSLKEAMKESGKFNFVNKKLKMQDNNKKTNPKEEYIKLIEDKINKDFEQMEKEDKEWANTFDKYLDVMGYDSAGDFKADIMWMALDNDNENFKLGKTNAFNFNLNDSGEMEVGNELYSYRKAIAEAKKRIKYFNKYLDEDD